MQLHVGCGVTSTSLCSPGSNAGEDADGGTRSGPGTREQGERLGEVNLYSLEEARGETRPESINTHSTRNKGRKLFMASEGGRTGSCASSRGKKSLFCVLHGRRKAFRASQPVWTGCHRCCAPLPSEPSESSYPCPARLCGSSRTSLPPRQPFVQASGPEPCQGRFVQTDGEAVGLTARQHAPLGQERSPLLGDSDGSP